MIILRSALKGLNYIIVRLSAELQNSHLTAKFPFVVFIGIYYLPLFTIINQPLHHLRIIVGEKSVLAVSSAAMAAMSSGANEKSKTLKFSIIRSL